MAFLLIMVSGQPPLHKSQQSQLRQRHSRIFIFVLIGFCLFFFMRYTSRLIEYGQERVTLERWEQKIADAKLEQAELLALQEYVQTDAYVEEISRRELQMARPGDTLLVVLSGDEAVAEEFVKPAEDNYVANSNKGRNSAAEQPEVATGEAIDTSTSTSLSPPLTTNWQNAGSALSETKPPSAIQHEPVWRQWILLFSQSP